MAKQRSNRPSSRLPPVPRVGSFELMRQIGAGGMGRVFMARHAFLHRLAAVKLLRDDLPDKERLLQMFRSEAQALAKVVHPNVVQVLDIGRDHGIDFIAMDFAPGLDLARRLKNAGRLERDQIIAVARKLIEAIAAAHAAGVLHRDIKPDNVVLDDSGGVKVTDFGLAGDIRMIAAGLNRQTHATPAYAAPEVLRGWRSDFRSDVFSIGATLYHCATGLLPFGATSRQSVLAAQKTGAQPIQELCPELPKSLATAIMRAIDPEDENRPANAGEFLLLAFPDYRPSRNRGKRSRWLVPVAGGVAGAIIAAVLFWPFGGGAANPPTDPTQTGQRPSTDNNSGSEPEQDQGRGDSPAARLSLSRLMSDSRESRASLELAELNLQLASRPIEERRVALRAFATKHDGTEAAADARRLAGDGPLPLSQEQIAEVQRVKALLAGDQPLAGLLALSALAEPIRQHPEAESLKRAEPVAAEKVAQRWETAVRLAEPAIMREQCLKAEWGLDLATDLQKQVRLGVGPVPEWASADQLARHWNAATQIRNRIDDRLAAVHRQEISRVWESRYQSYRLRASQARELERTTGRLITEAARGTPTEALAAFGSTDWTIADGQQEALKLVLDDFRSLHDWMRDFLHTKRNQTVAIHTTASDGKTAVAQQFRVNRVEADGFEATTTGGGAPVWVSYGTVHPRSWVDLGSELPEAEKLRLHGRVMSMAQARQISFERTGIAFGREAVDAGQVLPDRVDQMWWSTTAQPLISRLVAIQSITRQTDLGSAVASSELRRMLPRDQEAVEAHWAAIEKMRPMLTRPQDVLPVGAWSPFQSDGRRLHDSEMLGPLAVYVGQAAETPSALLDPILLGIAIEAGPPSRALVNALLRASPGDPVAGRQVAIWQEGDWKPVLLSALRAMPNDPELWKLTVRAGLGMEALE